MMALGQTLPLLTSTGELQRMSTLASFLIENPVVEHILNHPLMSKFIMVSLTLITCYLITKLLNKIIRDTALRRALGELRVMHISRLVNIGMTFICLIILCLLVGLDYREISVFLSSIFAVVGIALFAQWSILSNVTASMIIFFSFPYQVGDRIRILEKDEDIEGIIQDITMFHVILLRDDLDLISYPNSLILQKAVLQLRSSRKPKACDKPEELSDLDHQEAPQAAGGLAAVKEQASAV
jgi:small-conductance mechanosensitive channel